jgi:hypothetical protein
MRWAHGTTHLGELVARQREQHLLGRHAHRPERREGAGQLRREVEAGGSVCLLDSLWPFQLHRVWLFGCTFSGCRGRVWGRIRSGSMEALGTHGRRMQRGSGDALPEFVEAEPVAFPVGSVHHTQLRARVRRGAFDVHQHPGAQGEGGCGRRLHLNRRTRRGQPPRALHRCKQLRIVRFGLGTARQKRLLERWTNPKPLQAIWYRAAI